MQGSTATEGVARNGIIGQWPFDMGMGLNDYFWLRLPNDNANVGDPGGNIFLIAHGVQYLGRHFCLTDTGKVIKRLCTQNKRRLKRRLKGLPQGYTDGQLNWKEAKHSMASTHGHLSHMRTYRLREKLYSKTIYP